jgi:RNA polymerase sigma factor (sigma-70 family)
MDRSLDGAMGRLRRVAAVQALGGLSDRELLERFVAAHDEAAFTVLIERHGPMVHGACRRTLPNRHDAEDACQATFLVLARKAESLRKKDSLGSFLHGVACRVAAGLKREAARRKNRERQVDPPVPANPATEASWREVQDVLDEELGRLPEQYRAPLILCYLECLTRDEAARQLGLSPGGLHGRLERGRDLLRKRLIGRGLSLSASLTAAALGENVTHALSPTFVITSTKAAALFAAGQPLMESVGANVLVLTQEVLKSMYLAKVKMGTAGVLCAALLTLAGGSFVSLGNAQDARPKPQQAVVKSENDGDFIRRISKDLRNTEPTPAEIHFFVANKDSGKRQKLIDLFIQERQAKKAAAAVAKDLNSVVYPWTLINPNVSNTMMWQALGDPNRINVNYTLGGLSQLQTLQGLSQLQTFQNVYNPNLQMLAAQNVYNPNLQMLALHRAAAQEQARLGTLQREFYKALRSAKDKADVARITQAYLDRLIGFLKEHPQSPDAPDAIRQIVLVYESQGKTVEADAWRAKVPKEAPKTSAEGNKGK